MKNISFEHCQVNDLRPLAQFLRKELQVNWSGYQHNAISLSNNPLQIPPPEIVKQGNAAILAYFDSLEQAEATPTQTALNEVKVLLIGGGGSGKTSLVKKIIDQPFDPHESQTHGIRISNEQFQIKDANIAVNFWDFGGQEINHATHQFFYSKRSLYLLVLDSRQDQKAEYWLKYIESFGGNSPIIIVLNKVDENPAFEVNRRFLQEKYPGIQRFFRVSCATEEGIDALKAFLLDQLYELELRKTIFSEKWLAVKQQLSSMAEPYISYEHYYRICLENKVEDRKQQDTLLGFIHDLGVALHFESLRRFDKQVLSPHWLTNGVYRIINAPQIPDRQNGEFHFGQLEAILNDQERFADIDYQYPAATHLYLVEIMQQFELCFELKRDTYIVPDLLPVEEPAGLHLLEYPLHFVVQYNEAFPRSIIPRFMVQMHNRISADEQHRWRTGVVLKDPLFEAEAVVRADYEEKEIHLWVKGSKRRLMLTSIRNTLKEIHASFAKLQVTEWLVIQELGPKELIKVKYATLLAHERNNRPYFCPELEQDFPAPELLDGIERPEDRVEMAPLTAYISYSEADTDLKNKLKVMLKSLEHTYQLKLWDESSIDAGTERSEQIITHLQQDPLILLLISPDFITADHIWTVEVPGALSRQAKGEAVVIPVILRPCLWDKLDFGRLQALPANQKPVSGWKDPDETLLDVARGVEKVLNSAKLQTFRRKMPLR